MGDLVGDFVTYATAARAAAGLRVRGGLLRPLRRDGVDPQPLKGVIQHVRNFHRFHGSSLTTLQDGLGDGQPGNLPFTLVLYPALDHNAAFHRDAHIREVITNANNFTLVIEGATGLGDITHRAARPWSAASAGPTAGGVRRLQQVMIAGHGRAARMELAGDAVPATRATRTLGSATGRDDLDLDANPAANATAVRRAARRDGPERPAARASCSTPA